MSKYHFIGLALLISFILAGVSLHSIEYHAASILLDDMSTTYSYLMQNPERYQNDILGIYGIASLAGTIINWGSGWVWTHFDIDPKTSYTVIAFLQFITMGMAAFFLTREFTRNDKLALFSIIFVFGSDFISWNLANYATLYPRVYAGYFALAICTFALLFAIRRWRVSAMMTLVFAGLIHPSVTLYAFLIIGLYWVWQIWSEKAWRDIGYLFLLCLCGVPVVMPGLLASQFAIGEIPADLLQSSRQVNRHFFPFSSIEALEFMMPFTAWIIVALISSRDWDKLPNFVIPFLRVMLVAVILLTLTHILGQLTGISTLILLVGGRSTQYLTLFCMPMILLYGYNRLYDGKWYYTLIIFVGLFSVFDTFFPANHLLIAFSWVFLALADKLPSLSSRMRQTLRSIALLVLGIWAMAILSGIIGLYILIILVVFVALILYLTFRSKSRKPTIIAVTGIFTLLTALSLYAISASIKTPAIMTLYDAQLWARDNTAEDAVFAGLYPSWRAVSNRAYVNMLPRPWYVYILDERLVNYEAELLALYDADFDNRLDLERYVEKFNTFDKDIWLMIAQKFHIDYLVYNENNSGNLNFPIVYSNDNYIIYDLRVSNSE